MYITLFTPQGGFTEEKGKTKIIYLRSWVAERKEIRLQLSFKCEEKSSIMNNLGKRVL